MRLILSRFYVPRTTSALAFFVCLFFLASCSSTPVQVSPAAMRSRTHTAPSPVNPGSGVPRLRIHNSSPYPLQNLTVIFPQDHISFGDVPAWATTSYRDVPHGVYAYAAYEGVLEGKNIYQAVVDWIGESPLPGETFTYRIMVDPDQYSRNRTIQLIQVTQEEQIQP